MRNITASAHYSSLAGTLSSLGGLLRGRSFEKVKLFEERFAAAEGAKFAVATSMARIALYQVLLSLKVQPGDRILLSPVNIPEMLAVIETLGLEPVFVDFSPDSLFVSAGDLEAKAAASGAKIFFLTYVAGQIGDLAKVREVTSARGLTLIQDATQAGFCRFNGKPICSWADFTLFSTCELKFVHTYRGGMICVNSAESAEKLRSFIPPSASGRARMARKWALDTALAAVLHPFLFRYFFFLFRKMILTQDPLEDFRAPARPFKLSSLFDSDYARMRNGIPPEMLYRPSDFEAESGLRSLSEARSRAEAHVRAAQVYRSSARHLPRTHSAGESSYWRFPLIFPDAGAARNFTETMRKNGVNPEKSGLALLSGDVPQARSSLERCVFVPAHAGLTSADVKRVAALLRQYA